MLTDFLWLEHPKERSRVEDLDIDGDNINMNSKQITVVVFVVNWPLCSDAAG